MYLCFRIIEAIFVKFSFFYENNMGSKIWEIKLQKIVGNLLDKLRKLYLNGTVIQNRPHSIAN